MDKRMKNMFINFCTLSVSENFLELDLHMYSVCVYLHS